MTKIGHKGHTKTVNYTGDTAIADKTVTANAGNLRQLSISWTEVATATELKLRTTSVSGTVIYSFWLFGTGSIELNPDIYFSAGIYLENIQADVGSGLAVNITYDEAANEFKRFSNDDSGSFR